MSTSLEAQSREDTRRIPDASYRRTEASDPWPWVGKQDDIDPNQLDYIPMLPPVPPPCDHISCGGCWKGYPQSRFPDWTRNQVLRSNISKTILMRNPSTIYQVIFTIYGFHFDRKSTPVPGDNPDRIWENMIHTKEPKGVKLCALFVQNMSGHLLQMLGTKYNIDPLFFSSSINWIPSRNQKQIRPLKGDHITFTLTFLRSHEKMPTGGPGIRSGFTPSLANSISSTAVSAGPASRHYLALDLLSVYLIRSVDGSTLISYHSNTDHTTTAHYLEQRASLAGQGIYWQNILESSLDSTFILLVLLWHAMRSWDEALGHVSDHISWLESQMISTSNILMAHELFHTRAYCFRYSSLLEDFKKTIEFVRDTRNPAMDALEIENREFSAGLMARECDHLLSKIHQLEGDKKTQEKRLKNAMDLVLSTFGVGDSQRMQQMTEAAMRDSAVMKQIAYMTMVYLPASFVATVFGMNIKTFAPDTEGTLLRYIETTIALTFLTIWIVIAFQSKYIFAHGRSVWARLAWPFLLF
ncbi:hypothetical protein BDZ94DRAFT_1169292 [Collybia nuda]|uniref:Uncharacterized protein n=1 Tax=Collybia nuda TaxID=64659 RepID=A0A9P5Y3I6_9AGAR|nr:hypothetical protein BDZ94DRAFT_1169292 [Collybia nuda]